MNLTLISTYSFSSIFCLFVYVFVCLFICLFVFVFVCLLVCCFHAATMITFFQTGAMQTIELT